jgi:uncharacterized SAM-binding protein YcdF (DUF218 family)
MFFIVSKAFFLFARPLHFLLLLMVIGLGLQLSRARRLGVWLVNLAAVCWILFAFSPLAAWLEAPLEQRFPRPGTLDPAPDGIIILGGALDADLSALRPDFYALNDAGERLTEVPRLAKLYPNAKVIYTGGPFGSPPGTLNEAQNARRLLIDLGVPADRITIEEHSLTTWENAVMSKAIVNPAPDSHWLLVTSAFHMPRSVGTFRKAGWPGIIAYPTDYRLPDPRYQYPATGVAIDNLTLIEIAAKEWYGLLGYWLGGRSTALFPAP